MKVILYTLNCPQCTVLESTLKKANISFETCSDMNTMRGLGISTVPVLSVDGKLMRFPEAFKWAKEGR